MRQMGLTKFQGWTGEQKTRGIVGVLRMPTHHAAMLITGMKTTISGACGCDKNLPSFLLDANSGVK
jgi:hypothetical protein